MTVVPVEETELPPYRHWGPCALRRARADRVHFDQDCTEARGNHYHRLCLCGHQWVERCSDEAAGRFYF
jgi:hypothetical protein